MTTLAQAFDADPEIALEGAVGGTLQGAIVGTETPSALVAEMTPERADAVREEYAGQLVVEPDAPLEPSEEGSVRSVPGSNWVS